MAPGITDVLVTAVLMAVAAALYIMIIESGHTHEEDSGVQ